ncbi:hypothetical protein AM571_PA00352 (plasmid) [Rhizobium etli 8C-3]|uniref:Uncharacterized protein n=1 Tax=Rhizobium etli 8C-3 TaxID=538025 RepID=A0A1L5PAU7_RHIET|nr:hypothetical protein AM571_PA00352 [Rhizobium etli 8C-3]
MCLNFKRAPDIEREAWSKHRSEIAILDFKTVSFVALGSDVRISMAGVFGTNQQADAQIPELENRIKRLNALSLRKELLPTRQCVYAQFPISNRSPQPC